MQFGMKLNLVGDLLGIAGGAWLALTQTGPYAILGWIVLVVSALLLTKDAFAVWYLHGLDVDTLAESYEFASEE